MTQKIPVILLIGAGHSGSTLMDLIVGSHSQIFGVGELSYYSRIQNSHSPCACGEYLEGCLFWQHAFNGVNSKKMPLIYQPKKEFIFGGHYFCRGKCPVDKDAYLDNLECVYRNILEISDKKIIFDSSKSPDRAKLIVESKRFDVTIIHLVRDGRGVLFSNIKRGQQTSEIIRHWISINIKSEIVKIRNRSGENMTIRYRDFVLHTKEVIKKVLSLEKLTFESSMFDSTQDESHQVGGNGPVKKAGRGNLRLDLSWKKGLAGKQKWAFNILAGWLNIFYIFWSDSFK